MIFAKAGDLCKHLIEQGFTIRSYQEEDPAKAVDAEVEIRPNVVVQIGYGASIEYGLTVEPHHQKRANSGFHHVGYYDNLDSLIGALKKVCPQISLGTWKEIIVSIAVSKGEFETKDLYKELEKHPKTQTNGNYKAKIRQTLRNSDLFKRTAKGRWALVQDIAAKNEAGFGLENLAAV